MTDSFLPNPDHSPQQAAAAEQACASFQASMPAILAAGEDLQLDPHLRSCPRCQALVRDLEAIAEAARQLMPADPPDTLWDQIQRAIALEEQPTNPFTDRDPAHD